MEASCPSSPSHAGAQHVTNRVPGVGPHSTPHVAFSAVKSMPRPPSSPAHACVLGNLEEKAQREQSLSAKEVCFPFST